MGVAMKKFCVVDTLPASTTLYYTATAPVVTASISSIVFQNKSTAPQTVTLIISGVTYTIPLTPGQIFGMDSIFAMITSDTIRVYATAASAVSAYISGVEVSP